MLKFKKSIMVLSFGMIGISTISEAQKLAFQGKTPANPTMIISIPDTTELWGAIQKSPIGVPARQLLEVSDASLDADAKQTLEKELGFAIDADSLMTQTLKGVDIYFVENASYPGFVINFVFKNAEHSFKVIDQIKREAAGASGSSGGIGADQVVDTMQGGARTLFLPAFEIYLAAEGNVLTYSNLRPAISSALQDEGRAVFSSDFYTRSMSHLTSEKYEMWSFGEPSGLAPLLGTLVSEENQATVQSIAHHAPSSTIYHFDPTFIKISDFKHQDDLPMAERRYSMTAPPAGDVSVLNFFPQDSVVVMGTNHFDGLALLEVAMSGLEENEATKPAAAAIEENLKASTGTLGFDVRTDLLSNLGPDFGIGGSKSTAGGPLPVDVVLVSKIKDTATFANVVDVMKKTFGEMEKAANKGAKAPDGSELKTGKTETYKEAEINTYTIPTGISGNISASFCVTQKGYFLFGLSDSSLKKAIDLSEGASGSMMENPSVKKALAELDKSQNTILQANTAALMADLEGIIGGALLQKKGDVDDKKAQALFEIIKAVKSLTTGTAYKNNGVKSQVFIEM